MADPQTLTAWDAKVYAERIRLRLPKAQWPLLDALVAAVEAAQTERDEARKESAHYGSMLTDRAVRAERDAAVARAEQAEQQAASLRDALGQVASQQRKTLGWIQARGIIFDGPLGRDPANWQHVAFSIYTDLCRVDTVARNALDECGDARLADALPDPGIRLGGSQQ